MFFSLFFSRIKVRFFPIFSKSVNSVNKPDMSMSLKTNMFQIDRLRSIIAPETMCALFKWRCSGPLPRGNLWIFRQLHFSKSKLAVGPVCPGPTKLKNLESVRFFVGFLVQWLFRFFEGQEVVQLRIFFLLKKPRLHWDLCDFSEVCRNCLFCCFCVSLWGW